MIKYKAKKTTGKARCDLHDYKCCGKDYYNI